MSGLARSSPGPGPGNGWTVGRHGDVIDYTYRGLRDLTNRFANLLRGLGVGQGDRVFSPRRGRAKGNRIRPEPAAYPQREGHAPAAQSTRTGLPEGDVSTLEPEEL